MPPSVVIGCSGCGRHTGSFQHDGADRLVGLRPGIVIGFRPALPTVSCAFLHVSRGKEGPRLGKAREEPLVESRYKRLSARDNGLKTGLK
jgi:hypothetical protein